MDGDHSVVTDELRYWLVLMRVPGLGRARVRGLLSELGSPREIFLRAAQLAADLGLRSDTRAYLRAPQWGDIEPELSWLEHPNHHLITLSDPGYPELLAETADPPPLLFVHGNPKLLCSIQLAVVGSRNPTPSGRQTAREFARYLASAGITITSGMAVGIDGAAHAGALEAAGHTVAVTGTGLDRVYPACHRDLAHSIAEHGALVSEFPPGTPARRNHFPRRNRIISGLSLGTLVVEATRDSGSLITAREAADQGREVFAIPGSIHNPLARGCHQLIRQGAKLVETGRDIVEELGPLLGRLQQPSEDDRARPDNDSVSPPPEWDPQYSRLLAALEFDPLPVDVLIQRCALTADAVSSMLLLLELEGYVSSAPGGRYCLTRKIDENPAS